MEKEKIRYEKVIGNSILIAILASSIIIFILFFTDMFMSIVFPSHSSGTGSLDSEEAQAQNSKFTSYFGNYVSYKDVRLLLLAIYDNNVKADLNDELSQVGVIAPFAGDSVDKYSIDSIATSLQRGYTYKVEVINDYASDDMVNNSEKKALAGYYKNGFIKTIKITQNPEQDIYSNNISSNTINYINYIN